MTTIPINKILPNPEQPRTNFDEAELAGLAQSIKENTLIQPIVVEKAGENYILVDGERRWRAVKMLGRKTIEAIVREASNHKGNERLTLALVANVQRSNMGVVDEAKVYQQLYQQLGTMDEVAQKVGVDEKIVQGRIKLLELDPKVQELFNLKHLSFSNEIIGYLAKLNKEQQLRASTIAATRGWTIKGFRIYLKRELKGKNVPKNLYHGHDLKKNRMDVEVKITGHFDALALVPDWKSLPAGVAQTARKTCQACDLYEAAGIHICKQCPLPDFLRKLKENKQ
jgi:ParB family chromosome partitioning protein